MSGTVNAKKSSLNSPFQNVYSFEMQRKNCITRSHERRIKMDKKMKIIALAALLIYVISPVDIAPGPMDDMIMCLLYAVMNYKNIPRDVLDNKTES